MKHQVYRCVFLNFISLIFLSSLFAGNIEEMGSEQESSAPQKYTVDLLPDLEVLSLSCNPVSPTILETGEYTAVVKNVGDATAGASHVSIRIGSQTGIKYAVPALDPGETYSVTRYQRQSVALYYRVEAIADCNNEVTELVEDDSSITEKGPNEEWLNVLISNKVPNLAVTSLTFTPEVPNTDDTIQITAIIENIDKGTAAASTAILKIGSESFPPNYPVPLLKKGDTYTLTREINLPITQQFLVEVFADSAEIINEPDEDDNIETNMISVVHPVKIGSHESTETNRMILLVYSAPNSLNTLYSCTSLSTGTWTECSCALSVDGPIAITPIFTDYMGEVLIYVDKQSAPRQFYKVIRNIN